MTTELNTDLIKSDLRELTKTLARFNKSLRVYKRNAKAGVYDRQPATQQEHAAILRQIIIELGQFGYGFSQPVIEATNTGNGALDEIVSALSR